MANLNGQNIGTNYKGIINIGSTINQNVSASLQSLTDGGGNNLPIQFSTSQASIGGGTGTGRLVVRGDGTNPLIRLENSAGALRFGVDDAGAATGLASLTASGNITSGSGNIVSQLAIFSGSGSAAAITWNTGANGRLLINTSGISFDYSGATKTDTSGTVSLVSTSATYGAASGTAAFRNLNLAYTVNNTGAVTGSVTGIYLNATETNLNGATHNLMNLQVGGVSRFRIRGNGQVNMANLPTSSAGLSAGDLWNNGGVLNIV